ncbi:MAG: hypothetical protein GTO14_09325 [Anaerolineales bacterium]|nr:hypothetical protein [Anaerolineales bacterium]
MKLRHVFMANTIIALVYGISAVVIPTTIIDLHGMSVGPTGVYLGQLFGVSLIGIGLVTWLVRDVTDSQATNAIALGLLISDVVGFVVSLLAMLAGLMNALGWLGTGIYLLLALGYGYFRFVK